MQFRTSCTPLNVPEPLKHTSNLASPCLLLLLALPRLLHHVRYRAANKLHAITSKHMSGCERLGQRAPCMVLASRFAYLALCRPAQPWASPGVGVPHMMAHCSSGPDSAKKAVAGPKSWSAAMHSALVPAVAAEDRISSASGSSADTSSCAGWKVCWRTVKARRAEAVWEGEWLRPMNSPNLS